MDEWTVWRRLKTERDAAEGQAKAKRGTTDGEDNNEEDHRGPRRGEGGSTP